MANLFTTRPPAALVAPSILAADFAHMGEDCRHALEHGADLLHLDVMDGHFVPNLTMGPDLCKALRRVCPEAFLDVHLMIEEPARYAEGFIDAGADHITAHAEVLRPGEVRSLSRRVRGRGASFGLAINPGTGIEPVMESLDELDLVLVMSVWPGFGGQAFLPEVLEKVRAISAGLGVGQRLEMDGGIDTRTGELCRQAGCDVLVAGSSVFGQPKADRGAAIRSIRA
ncbi:MAG: ribulose-phosphate 3-epimerase [Phycisphaerales bacterium]|nr:MAG: ribulose-phosphate 3-epimerase [Phycisphaerales bacterium]